MSLHQLQIPEEGVDDLVQFLMLDEDEYEIFWQILNDDDGSSGFSFEQVARRLSAKTGRSEKSARAVTTAVVNIAYQSQDLEIAADDAIEQLRPLLQQHDIDLSGAVETRLRTLLSGTKALNRRLKWVRLRNERFPEILRVDTDTELRPLIGDDGRVDALVPFSLLRLDYRDENHDRQTLILRLTRDELEALATGFQDALEEFDSVVESMSDEFDVLGD